MEGSSTPVLAEDILKLLDHKYSSGPDPSLDRDIFIRGIQVLEGLGGCIWCRQPRIAGELMLLLSFPENDCQRWFCRETQSSLSSCTECLEAYYACRGDLESSFRRLYEAGTLTAFWDKVAQFDSARINGPLREFLRQAIDAKDVPLLYALFELLMHPKHLDDVETRNNFSLVLRALVSCKKMIRVNRVLPGLFYCLFDSDDNIRQWATSVLKDERLEKADNVLHSSFPPLRLPNNCDLTREEHFHALLLLAKWLPRGASDVDREGIYGSLLKCLNIPSRFDDSLSGITCLLSTFHHISSDAWDAFVEGIFRNPQALILSLSKAEGPDLKWSALLSEHIVQSRSSGLLALIVEKLTSLLVESENALACQGIVRLGCCLLSQQAISALSRRLPALYSFLAECLQQATSKSHLKVEHVLNVLDCCWEAHAGVALDGNSKVRGFDQLLLQLALDKTFGKTVLERIYLKLASLEGDRLVFTIAKNISIIKTIYEASLWEWVAKDQSLCKMHLLLFILSSCRDHETIRLFMKSYPESFINGFYGAMQALNVTGVDDKLLERAPEKACILFVETFCSSDFTLGSETIIKLFPNKEDLYQKLALLALCLCGRSVGLFDDIPRPRLIEYEGILAFVATLCDNLPERAFKATLQKSALKSHTTSTLISSLAKFFSTNRSYDSKVVALVVGFLIKVSGHLDLKIGSSTKKMLAILMESVSFKAGEKRTLEAIIDEYEKQSKIVLPRPPADPHERQKKSTMAPPQPLIDLELEDFILGDLKSCVSRRQQRSLPISLRSAAIPLISKPTSKVDQLRAEVAQMVAPVMNRKRAIPNIIKKPQKLDQLASSASDSETEAQDFHSLKRRFESNMAHPTVEPTGRSVKLIDIASDPGDGAKRDGSKGEVNNYFYEVNLMKRFHRTILSFDLSDLDSIPDNVSTVPNSFTGEEQYISVFEPLLFMECRAQLYQSLQESAQNGLVTSRITGVAHVDDFHEVTIAGLDADTEEGRGGRPSDQDFVLAQFGRDTLPAIVLQSGMKSGAFEAVMRFLIPVDKAAVQLEFREGNQLVFKKTDNMVTSMREFLALHMVGRLTLSSDIFQPRLASVREVNVSPEITGLCRALNINHSQARAITAVLTAVNNITLIQGPPGTGKTKTIEGLLGALLGRSQIPGSQPKKILLCAPSNAAIDEIVRRIRDGVLSGDGLRLGVKIVRVGSMDMVSEQVKDVTLEAQVERGLVSAVSSSTVLLDSQRKGCDDLRRKLSDAEKGGQVERVKTLKSSLWEAKENLRKNTKFIEDTKANLRQKILKEAHVVCCTLSSSGHDSLSRFDFDYVIIDEACQAVELSCLVPLQYNVRHCVLVGDPNQLPPTVISQAAGVFSYEQSLFVRVQKQCPQSILLLDTQYRMHPDISCFPNGYFYEGRLIDGPEMHQTNSRPWHRNPILGPFRFFDVPGREESWRRDCGIESRSKMNEQEARIAANLVAMICEESSNLVSDALLTNSCTDWDLKMVGKIGIVTPYKDQRRALRREISYRFGRGGVDGIEISTVVSFSPLKDINLPIVQDGFQGQEREVIIFSCVRTGDSKGIGFLNDTRRLNVALTRAKCSLFVLGKASTLSRNPIWRAMIDHAKAKDSFIPYDDRMWASAAKICRLRNFTPSPTELASKKIDHPPAPINKPTAIQTSAQRQLEQQNRSSPMSSSTSSPTLTRIASPRKRSTTVVDDLLDGRKLYRPGNP